MALDNKIKEQLNQYMTKLINPVAVVANLDDGPLVGCDAGTFVGTRRYVRKNNIDGAF